MAGKARVHELAKELGVESKTVLARLKDLGEFVKSASSTVEAPVARRLREAFAEQQQAPAKPAPAPTPAAGAKPGAKGAPKPTPATVRPKPVKPAPAHSAQDIEAKAAEAKVAELRAAQEAAAAAARAAQTQSKPAEDGPPADGATGTGTGGAQQQAPAASAGTSASAPAASSGSDAPPRPSPRPGGPRPGPRPSAARPGNNPFGVGAGTPTPRPSSRPGGSGSGGHGGHGGHGGGHGGQGGSGGSGGGNRQGSGSGSAMPPRPGGTGGGGGGGGNRPNPGMMPSRPSPGSMPSRPARSGSGPGGGSGGGRGGPGGGGGGRGGPGGGGGGRSGGGGGGGFRSGPGGGGGGGGAPAGGGGFRGGGGRPGGGGRGRGGGTAGAFGRPGGRPARGRKSKKQRRQEFDNLSAPTMQSGAPQGRGQTVRLARGASLSDFADKIDANPGSLVQEAFNIGEMVTATQSCSDEVLQLLADHLGYVVEIVSPEDEDRELLARFDLEFDGDYGDQEFAARPPVVTVMGHVDHGKTRLLDAIRKANVVDGEAGGITQHIGAYQVHVGHEGRDRAITFIDTPGHEAFTAMRARGAETTDIVVLVVAADDGVKPQTIEALNHAQAAKVPIVVAVNKIDKEGADPTKIRGQLTEYGLVPEEYGGESMFVDISARQSINIEGLLEAVLLTADAALELTAPLDVPAQGTAIEAHLDRGRGPVATVLVQRGVLKVGDSVVSGEAHGRVRAMLDEYLKPVDEAGPSRPVRVLGLTAVPGAGDNFLVVPEDRVARQIAEQRQARERNAQQAARRSRPTLESIFDKLKEGEKTQLALILKGDVSGSVEALEDSLLKIEVPDEVSLQIIGRGVGAITENDINLARTTDAVIIGFNVRPERNAEEMANREHVDIRYYNVIYAAIDDIESAVQGMLKPEYEEAQLGTAEVREVFRSSKFGNIAGCLVRTGLIRRNSKARLIRDGVVVAENLNIGSLRRFKDDATEVRDGFECGIGLGTFNDIRVDDVIETFEMREKPRT